MKSMIKLLLIQFLVLISLLVFDIYFLRGYYSSAISIGEPEMFPEENSSIYLDIIKVNDTLYSFNLKNNSLTPKYFVNYRNGEYFQSIDKEFALKFSTGNIKNGNNSNCRLSFDCGTGLGSSCLKPLENFKLTKSYQEIISEFAYFEQLKNLGKKYRFVDSNNFLNNSKTDSILKNIIVPKNDSIEVEYCFTSYSFIAKNENNTYSNTIKLSIKDLLDKYIENENN